METNDLPSPETQSSAPPRRSGWKILRQWPIGFACLVTLVALGYSVENWRGKRAWNRFQRDMAALGEKLDLPSLAPPPVPDEQNLALIPLFQASLNYVQGKDGAITQGKQNGQSRINAYREMPGRKGSFSVGSLQRGTYTDLETGREFYQDNTNYPQADNTASAAETVLVALGLFDPEFKELADAAAARPACRFPVHYADEFPAATLLPHLGLVKQITVVNQLRAIARLDLGQSAPALADLKLGFRLADGLRQEPFLISHLVRIAILHLNLQIIREGLVRHAWSDAQLAELDRLLASVDVLADFKQSMRGLPASAVSNLDFLRRRTSLAGIVNCFLGSGTFRDVTDLFGEPNDDELLRQLVFLVPSGWYYQNMACVGRVYQDHVRSAVDVPNHRFFPDTGDAAMAVLERHKQSPYRFFAAMVFPSASKAGAKAARAQTFVDQARIACALERHRLAQGKSPDTLAPLTPRFLPRIPTDVFDGQPLRYRALPEGGYLIYSIGLNQKDDGGKAVLMQGGKNPDDSQGDWVWQMAERKS